MNRWSSCVVVCLIAAIVGGCSDSSQLPTAKVTGKVLHNGQPLTTGSISFQPEAGWPASGQLQSDGSFTLTTYHDGDGAIIGKHRVLINATSAVEEAGPNVEPQAPMSLVPEKYSSFSTSGLTADVTANGENSFTFELEGAAPARPSAARMSGP